MDTTIHGWPVIEEGHDQRLRVFAIPGVSGRTLHLREDIGPYLVAFAARYHELIAPLDVGIMDVWSWVEPRKGRASNKPSDHCAGVAIDLNATKEGAQDRANFTAFWQQPGTAERLAILRAEFDLLEWGGDYETFYDPMHWTLQEGIVAEDVLARMRTQGISVD